MAGEVVQRSTGPRDRKKRRGKRRIAVRIDMTPMVDIAFLLLIFYMVSTVFAMPQAIEVNLPPPDEVFVKKLLTIRVDSLDQYWWNLGEGRQSNLPRRLPPGEDTLRGLLEAQNTKYPRLSTLLVIHPDADYERWVDFLDVIGLITRQWEDRTPNCSDCPPPTRPDSQKFSYRYALGDWGPRDSKLIAAAREAAGERGDLR